ncbi:hypothetical protein Tco_0616694, partial [Tanacetum coccineum]
TIKAHSDPVYKDLQRFPPEVSGIESGIVVVGEGLGDRSVCCSIGTLLVGAGEGVGSASDGLSEEAPSS